jgi:hypothetical protein
MVRFRAKHVAPAGEKAVTSDSHQASVLPTPKAPDLQLFYQSMYKEERDQARQHETLRQQSTTLLFALSGAISAATAGIIGSTATNLLTSGGVLVVGFYSVFGIFVSAIGWFGRELSLKHFELSDMHFWYATQYRLRLQEFFPGSSIDLNQDEANGKDCDRHRAMKARDAYQYWIDLYLFLIALGVVLAIMPIALIIFWYWPQISLWSSHIFPNAAHK